MSNVRMKCQQMLENHEAYLKMVHAEALVGVIEKMRISAL